MEKPKEQLQCAYCGEKRERSELKEATIIHQGRDAYGRRCVLHTKNLYCKESACASYDQMAHEG